MFGKAGNNKNRSVNVRGNHAESKFQEAHEMIFSDDSLLPENQEKLIITAAPYGPRWLPRDYPGDIPVTWDAQVQAAVECYNAGATHLSVHVRDPKTGELTTDFGDVNYLLGRLKQAVPKMILSISGSISFAPAGRNGKAKRRDGNTRCPLAELEPKPEQSTIAMGAGMMDVVQMWREDDVEGAHLTDSRVRSDWAGLWAEAGPAFYVEHLKRLRANGIQPYFMLGYVKQLEIVERLIRAGLYAGPVNHCLAAVGGRCARNPFEWMEYLRLSPHGATLTFVNNMCAVAIALGVHVRVGIEDNIWRKKRERFPTVKQVEQVVRISKEIGREVATADEARRIMKIDTWYNSADETLFKLGLAPNHRQGPQVASARPRLMESRHTDQLHLIRSQ
jgi:uncharacterized protein (DUF849 family)